MPALADLSCLASRFQSAAPAAYRMRSYQFIQFKRGGKIGEQFRNARGRIVRVERTGSGICLPPELRGAPPFQNSLHLLC
jgi:hypothetical protein